MGGGIFWTAFAIGAALCVAKSLQHGRQKRSDSHDPSDPLPVGNGDTLGGCPGAPAELFQIEDDGWVTVRPAFNSFHDTPDTTGRPQDHV